MSSSCSRPPSASLLSVDQSLRRRDEPLCLTVKDPSAHMVERYDPEVVMTPTSGDLNLLMYTAEMGSHFSIYLQSTTSETPVQPPPARNAVPTIPISKSTPDCEISDPRGHSAPSKGAQYLYSFAVLLSTDES